MEERWVHRSSVIWEQVMILSPSHADREMGLIFVGLFRSVWARTLTFSVGRSKQNHCLLPSCREGGGGASKPEALYRLPAKPRVGTPPHYPAVFSICLLGAVFSRARTQQPSIFPLFFFCLLQTPSAALTHRTASCRSESWYTRFEPQLYLYGKAAGVVSDLAVWRAGR